MHTSTDPVLARVRDMITPDVGGAFDRFGNSVAKFAFVAEGAKTQASEFCGFMDGMTDGEALLLMAYPSTANLPLRMAQAAEELVRTAQVLVTAAEGIKDRQQRIYAAAKQEHEQGI